MADPNVPSSGSASKLEHVQGQVNEVKVILKDNIDKVLERGDRLDDLIGKTGDLQASRTSTRVARKYWWRNIKMLVIIGAIVLIVLILIILAATKVI